MAARPAPADFVLRGQLEQAFPQITVFDGLAAGGFPAVALPVAEPVFREGVLQVLAVGRYFNAARFLQGFEGPDGSRQLHAVVGRAGLVAARLAGVAAAPEQVSPAAFAGPRFTRAVRPCLYVSFHACRLYVLQPLPARGRRFTHLNNTCLISFSLGLSAGITFKYG